MYCQPRNRKGKQVEVPTYMLWLIDLLNTSKEMRNVETRTE